MLTIKIFRLSSVVCVIGCLITVATPSDTVACWVCEHVAIGSLKINEKCTDPFTETVERDVVEQHECQYGYYCVKRVIKTSGGNGYLRTCEPKVKGLEEGCTTKSKDGRETIECYCSGKLCNTAQIVAAAAPSLLIGAVGAAMVASKFAF